MNIDPHDLVHEFPEQADKIHELKMSNAHFQRLQQEYATVNKAVVQAEEGIQVVDDAHLEELKKQRLHLKDQLAAILAG